MQLGILRRYNQTAACVNIQPQGPCIDPSILPSSQPTNLETNCTTPMSLLQTHHKPQTKITHAFTTPLPLPPQMHKTSQSFLSFFLPLFLSQFFSIARDQHWIRIASYIYTSPLQSPVPMHRQNLGKKKQREPPPDQEIGIGIGIVVGGWREGRQTQPSVRQVAFQPQSTIRKKKEQK
ncbi:hypothetical protein BS50DRAFT_235516 [Corynespora cassiicola Philippines]|uniref:Uncharacterized protein n=1 Tax=Corynespora cassiicola Philippines TaxID=1448308 RepID=A0A2T2P2A8_CORCC|nr:hypothetical protein BS50DRAFT_235516 [Corynespora cassiicola Philippines]